MELFNETQTGCGAEFFQPLHAYLNAKKSGALTPPFIPRWDVMPIHQLCKLAKLWHESGFEKEAGELASWLASLKEFPTFWCSEKEYRPQEFKQLFPLLSKIVPIDGKKPNFTLLENGAMTSLTTLWGNKTPLGSIRANNVEIRAMGPQSDSFKFGIKGKGANGWTQTFAYPEVWLELKEQMEPSRYKMDLRFVGLTNENPLFFSFYVKAQSCEIGAEILKPKSLRRFIGEASRVKLDGLLIESALPHKVQVIPLAGAGCYWDCEFLVSFEIHPFAPQANFIIT